MRKRIAVFAACFGMLVAVVVTPVGGRAGPVGQPLVEEIPYSPLYEFASYCGESEEQNYTCYLMTQALLEKEAEIDWEGGGYPGDTGDEGVSDDGGDSVAGATIQSIDVLTSFDGAVPGSLLFGIDPETQLGNNMYALEWAELSYNWLLGYKLDWYSVGASCPPNPTVCAVKLVLWALALGPNPVEFEFATIGAGYFSVEWANYGGTTERWQLGTGYKYGNEGVWEEANYHSDMNFLGTWCAFPTIHNPLGYELGPCRYLNTVWEQLEDSHPNSPGRDYVMLDMWLNNNGITEYFAIITSVDGLPIPIDLGGVDIVPR